jgi:hypothetical protein
MLDCHYKLRFDADLHLLLAYLLLLLLLLLQESLPLLALKLAPLIDRLKGAYKAFLAGKVCNEQLLFVDLTS